MDSQDQPQPPATRVFRWVLCGMLIVAGFFLLTEHRAHLLGVLPYLLFAACPLMHLFIHYCYFRHLLGPSSWKPSLDLHLRGDIVRSGDF